ncbi:19909_t:CDS:1, partial [Racocetra fulgida]
TGAPPGVGGISPMGIQGSGRERPQRHPFEDKRLGNPPQTAPQSQRLDPQPNSPISQQQQPNPQADQQPNSPVNRQQLNLPKASPVPNVSPNGVADQNAHKTHETENAKQTSSPSTNSAKHSNSPQGDSDPRHNETTASNGGFKNVGCDRLTTGIVTIIMMCLWIYGVGID